MQERNTTKYSDESELEVTGSTESRDLQQNIQISDENWNRIDHGSWGQALITSKTSTIR